MTDTVQRLPAENTVNRLLRQGRITSDEAKMARALQVEYDRLIPSREFIAWLTAETNTMIVHPIRLSRAHLVRDILVLDNGLQQTQWHYRLKDGVALEQLKIALADWQALTSFANQMRGGG